MNALPPGSVIGILGGGQLGRMLAMAAARLGLQVSIYSDHTGPAFDVASAHMVGDFSDLDKVRKWAETVDVITYEFENVPLDAAAAAAAVKPVRPGAQALEVAQDRLTEKTFIQNLGIPVAPFAAIDSAEDIPAALTQLGGHGILKTRRLGYDGKGQVRIDDVSQAETAFSEIGKAPAILEGLVGFDSEVSVILVRGLDKTSASYDIPLNDHENGILAKSTIPGPLNSDLEDQAAAMALKIADALDYVGVLAVEMFCSKKNENAPLIVNEIAPRVHNSGHWTMDACAVCQFENQIRAVAGWPIGSTKRHSNATMTNLIGADAGTWHELASKSGSIVHLYGKNEARPGRKMGHVNRIFPKEVDQSGS
ncbi:MAG: 5-(carboxyamino)imidazole ribonucleotide synthase [Filomicrobium sp.]